MRIRFLAASILALSLPAAAAEVSRDQLLDMVQKGVDTGLIVSLVEKDCVSFDVTADNLVELSARLPREVLQAASDCRKGKTSGKPARAATPAPKAAPGSPTEAAPPRDMGRPLRVASVRKLWDTYGIDEMRYPCQVPGQIHVQLRRAFGSVKIFTLDASTGVATEGNPACDRPDTKATLEVSGPADFSPTGRHQIVRETRKCGYMDGKCRLYLDGAPLIVEGTEKYKYPQWVWLDEKTIVLSNFGGAGGGPDAVWRVTLGE
jgi:hypothetical protein